MKMLIPVVSVLLLTTAITSAWGVEKPVKWLDDMAAAKSEAQKSGRPILADFTGSDWCGWCVKLEKEVFSQKAFLGYAGSDLVLFVADYPKRKKLPAKVTKQNEELLNKYQVTGFPTILLLDAEGKVLAQTGYQPGGAEAYVKHIKETLAQSGWKPPASANKKDQPANNVAAPVAK